ncbi:uroporphyrinogen-III synthase [Malassezia vespertilionis]|uniref:Tetrapyrrole biosynthesis uroporphyrinogen III synthase domain-containing protein n=1 Tax=Malassezia vespertilionis TaxID=2020962 RepID=A0A2N1JF90_9BASI|nr:uroporphyrinogen-III synthase [Malassezia vespertilionis]PKI85218.1 hypothetical protein MVES_001200 [Malassezia vespertilionis]WFD05941.1 uroporphyrinogen-III synthase [Malassezia vespertilionis]
MTERKPVSVLLLREPVSVSLGTDAYHDAFGEFCLPSFELSALATGVTTPEGEPISQATDIDFAKHMIQDVAYLMTHHKPKEYAQEYCIVSFPVLSHTLDNISDVAQKIIKYGESYDGVVLTSQRAVQAWTEAVKHISMKCKDVPRFQVPFYTVGPATMKALQDAQIPSLLAPEGIVGEDAGTGSDLAHRIAEGMQKTLPRSGDTYKLLYLVGDKLSSGLQDTLTTLHARVELDKMRVYTTTKDDRFAAHCRVLSKELQHCSGKVHGSAPDWLVFFSPSGGDYALPDLRAYGWIPAPGTPALPTHPKIGCIGPTTAAWVRERLGMEPDAVAAQPSPAALRDAILDATADTIPLA